MAVTNGSDAKARRESVDKASSAKKARVDDQRVNRSHDLTLPSGSTRSAHHEAYKSAGPYKYAAIGGLISDDLLESVVEESRTYGIRGEPDSLSGWGWEQKETDIYKIQQTPDLSSLDPEHLPDETLERLPALTRLKDALYSQEFRTFVREVTGCGPLSGKKTDGSVGLYTQGSHLLLHDDSISTRLVSYILYLPNSPPSAPSSSHVSLTPSKSGSFMKGWDPVWGGALELFPVENGDEVGLPGVKSVKRVDVKWGQIVFFEVQPGRSYHAVEEVVIGDDRQRLGVSGWFHKPIEGEEGYQPLDPGKIAKDLSSLAQITSAPTIPFTPYDSEPPTGLRPSDIAYLAPFLAPSYLTPSTLEKLSGQFVAASEIVLHNFLHPDVASQLKAEVTAADDQDPTPAGLIPPQSMGEGQGWSIQGPTSKHRYLTLDPSSSSSSSISTPTLSRIQTDLLPSPAFRAWLSVVSSLMPTARRLECRRFRRGLDYTLAAGEDRSGEVKLDVSLGATWWADVPAGSDEEEELLEHGGWECYLGSPEEGEDPAVFQSKHAKKDAEEATPNGTLPKSEKGKENGKADADPVEPDLTASSTSTSTSTNPASVSTSAPSHADGDKSRPGPSISIGGQELEFDPDQFSPSDFDSDSEGGDSDDGPLLTHAVGFNKLMIVLRDPGVMRFVKYLSAGARGSRWDVGGEWEVGVMEEEDDNDATQEE